MKKILSWLEKESKEIIADASYSLDWLLNALYDFFDSWAYSYPNLLVLCLCLFVLFSCGGCCWIIVGLGK